MNIYIKQSERKVLTSLNFSETLRLYMHKENISTDALASKCGISPYLIHKILVPKDHSSGKYIPFTIPIVLGIGLELPPSEIHSLMGKAGYVISDRGDPYNDALIAIIELPYPKTVMECSASLENAGYEKLTSFDIHIPHELIKCRRHIQ